MRLTKQDLENYPERQLLHLTDGWNYQTTKKLTHRLYNQDIEIVRGYIGKYYSLRRVNGWWEIHVHAGCCWDGASMYFDYEWIMYPSLIHDILHWLIAKGCIKESSNDLIDKELGDCIRYSEQPIKWFHGGEASRPFRARLVELGTNLVDEETKKLRLTAPEDRPIRILA